MLITFLGCWAGEDSVGICLHLVTPVGSENYPRGQAALGPHRGLATCPLGRLMDGSREE